VLTEEDHRSILIIGGIKIFLPISPAEASSQILGVAEERQPAMTIIEEKEKILKSSLVVEEEEHSDDMLTPWEKELKFLEDFLCHPDT
jgi:hypothetical protein